MKFMETHFDDYLRSVNVANMHPKIAKLYSKLPVHFKDFKNIILYGPAGVGKYTQMLKIASKYSSSELKYEKKISVSYLKQLYILKISDIHYEIDMALLGCNSKLLWHEIYTQIVDIISAKTCKRGIIVCKNFQETHSDLLDNFYSYMQTKSTISIDVKFILITEAISFIPDNIHSCCKTINIPRPTKLLYNKCVDVKLVSDSSLEYIKNIKCLKCDSVENIIPHKIICDKIIHEMMHVEDLKYIKFRDLIYDAFIVNLDIPECTWYILTELMSTVSFLPKDVPTVFIKTFEFLQYYNNNYRPIYHFEHYLLYLTATVNHYDLLGTDIIND
jgi:Cdc6-like AAA superfamily ATPase